jgi:hypothetical protein
MIVIAEFPPMIMSLEAFKQAQPCLTFDTS